MNYIQDVREAHQMWEYKFQNAGREGIVLSSGKPGLLFSLLGRVFHGITAKSVIRGSNVKLVESKSSATS